MVSNNFYRSFLAAGLCAASLLSAACNQPQKTHATMKQEQVKRFNLAKLGVTLQLAQQQYAVGDFEKCRQTLQDAFALKEPNAGVEMLAAKVDIETGSLETACTHLKEAIALSPQDPEPQYLLGVVYQRWQKMETAAEHYQAAWGLKPGEARYMLALVEMKITLGQLDDAQNLLESKAEYFEQSAAVRIAMARIAMLKKDYLAASKHYRDAYLLLSDDMNVKRAYGESLYFAGKYADAVPLLDDVRGHLKPSDNGLTAQEVDVDKTSITLMLGNCYLNVHRIGDARACFQDVAQAHPENLQAVLGLGKVCIETNELPAALSAGKRILRSEPRNVQAMILVALVQQKQKKWSDAFSTLEGAAAVDAKDSTVLCMQGVSLMKMGRDGEAVPYLEKAVAANPSDGWAADLLARVRPAGGQVSQSRNDSAPELQETSAPPPAASVTTALPARDDQAP